MTDKKQSISRSDNSKKSSKKLISSVKYMGLAFQLFATILVAVLVGHGIDRLLNMNKPIFTAILIPFFLFAFIYKLYKDLNQSE